MRKTSNQNIIDLRKGKPPEAKPVTVEKQRRQKARPKSGVLYEWDAPEFTKHEKDVYWFATLAIVSVALVIFFLLTKNYLGTLVVIMLAALVYVYSQKEPGMIHFAITPLGINVGRNSHPFEELKSFWIFYEPGEIKEVSFRTKRLTSPYLALPLGKANPVKVRQTLLKFLPEKKQEEPIANILARRLGF